MTVWYCVSHSLLCFTHWKRLLISYILQIKCGFGPHDPGLHEACIECMAPRPNSRESGKLPQSTSIYDHQSCQNPDSVNTLSEDYAAPGNHSTSWWISTTIWALFLFIFLFQRVSFFLFSFQDLLYFSLYDLTSSTTTRMPAIFAFSLSLWDRSSFVLYL